MKNIIDFATTNIFTGAITLLIISTVGTIITFLIACIKTKRSPVNEIKGNMTLRHFTLTTGVYALFSLIVSILLFTISTSFVEYPLDGTVYKKDEQGNWIKQSGRVSHSFFGGDTETVTLPSNPKKMEVSLSENSPFTVRYYISNADIPTILKNIDRPGGCGCNGSGTFEQNIGWLIRKKSYKLFFINKLESLVDDSTRKKIFQDYYAPYGITVDSVDFP